MSLLVPLIVYNLLMKSLATAAQVEVKGASEALGLMRSEVLFNLGYLLLWVGLFAAFRSGAPRKIVTVLFHVSALVVVIITTCANQYVEATGSTLDFSVIVFYLTTLGEVKNIIASETPWFVWILLVAALMYVILGPWALTRAIFSPGERRPARQQIGLTRLAAFGLCLISASLGVMSLVPGAAGANRAFSLSPPINVLATGIGGPDTNVDVGNVDSLAAASLDDAGLRPTFGTNKRNVVVILMESTPARATTPYNPSLETTPFLEELSKNSLLVERAYTTTPHTSKAITSVNCGIYPAPETGIVEARPENGSIPVRCLPDMLTDAGYNTVFFQSANEEFEDRPQLTQNFGYEDFFGLGSMDKDGFQRAGYLGYEDNIMLEPSRRWLEENAREKPFLATYLTITPHHEYLAPTRYGRKDYAEEDVRNRYLNAVNYTDHFIENVINQYKEMGEYEDTIFIIAGDHGEAFGEHGVKGHDGVPYEEGLRVPLIVHDPQRWRGGERISGDSPTNHMDIPPTILDMLGLETANGRYPGRSILDRPKNRTLHFNCRPDVLCMASTQGYAKYIYHYGQKPPELYDLRRDPLERNNLAGRVDRRYLDQRRKELLRWHAEAQALFDESE